MRQFTLSMLAVCLATTAAWGHHPDRENQPVHPRYDLIGPLGTNLKMSHRRRYNRPTKIGGKIAYYIAPSSQEAMAWHDATHRGYYENDRPRIVTHYFFAKPWEAIPTGPRISTQTVAADPYGIETMVEEGAKQDADLDVMDLPRDAPMANDGQLIE